MVCERLVRIFLLKLVIQEPHHLLFLLQKLDNVFNFGPYDLAIDGITRNVVHWCLGDKLPFKKDLSKRRVFPKNLSLAQNEPLNLLRYSHTIRQSQ